MKTKQETYRKIWKEISKVYDQFPNLDFEPDSSKVVVSWKVPCTPDEEALDKIEAALKIPFKRCERITSEASSVSFVIDRE